MREIINTLVNFLSCAHGPYTLLLFVCVFIIILMGMQQLSGSHAAIVRKVLVMLMLCCALFIYGYTDFVILNYPKESVIN